ncbi:MAG: hypothetical protein ACLPVY_25605 [Acidimicrobiia bacterium]
MRHSDGFVQSNADDVAGPIAPANSVLDPVLGRSNPAARNLAARSDNTGLPTLVTTMTSCNFHDLV